ncbi:MAG: hypothetical protein IKR59_01405 [Lachnospiraceae bacterium]|nr:hypothetical protein [Lachnospiraceae bacterium]
MAANRGNLQYVFVHGLAGWGSYDRAYRRMPYWGMRGGDLMQYLQSQGFSAYAASVDPMGSAWDRACELYAQLAGARTDYGKAHSKRCGHERFGKDFSGCPLIPEWNEDTRLVLLGHSFGGATIRLFSEILTNGDADEMSAGEDVSDFFKGGMGSRVHAIVTLASPLNGTSAYEVSEDESFDDSVVSIPLVGRLFGKITSEGTKPTLDGRDLSDYASYDLHIDHALELNRRMPVLPHVYYFSVPCSASEKDPEGCFRPKKRTEPLLIMSSCKIGAYAGHTAGGMTIDESWRENDGLVNTLSERAPFDAPSAELDPAKIEPGIWNICPTVNGDHMWPQGGMFFKHNIRGFYVDLLAMIRDSS